MNTQDASRYTPGSGFEFCGLALYQLRASSCGDHIVNADNRKVVVPNGFCHPLSSLREALESAR